MPPEVLPRACASPFWVSPAHACFSRDRRGLPGQPSAAVLQLPQLVLDHLLRVRQSREHGPSRGGPVRHRGLLRWGWHGRIRRFSPRQRVCCTAVRRVSPSSAHATVVKEGVVMWLSSRIRPVAHALSSGHWRPRHALERDEPISAAVPLPYARTSYCSSLLYVAMCVVDQVGFPWRPVLVLNDPFRSLKFPPLIPIRCRDLRDNACLKTGPKRCFSVPTSIKPTQSVRTTASCILSHSLLT